MNGSHYLPAISEATFPSAVVVVVAALFTPFKAFFKIFFGFIVARLFSAGPSFRVSERPGISLECR